MQKIGFNNRLGLQDAVLEGRKPLTRRIIPELAGKTNVRLSEFGIDDSGKVYITELNSGIDIYPKYQIGEVVAVAQSYKDAGYSKDTIQEGRCVRRGDHEDEIWYEDALGDYGEFFIDQLAGWTNKMFVFAEMMPHQIRITNIRYERLQDISDEDCLLEGIVKHNALPDALGMDRYKFISFCYDATQDRKRKKWWFKTPRAAFAALIDKVSGKGTWASNPWVWVYEFELVK